MISLFVAFTLAVRVSASFKLLGHLKESGLKCQWSIAHVNWEVRLGSAGVDILTGIALCRKVFVHRHGRDDEK